MSYGMRSPLLGRACCPTFQARPFPSLAKEGWLRQESNVAKPPYQAQTGWLVQTTDNSVVGPTTPSAPSKEASRHFHYCRVHPSLAKEGSCLIQLFGHTLGQEGNSHEY
jgi:hypothetical protein